MEQKSPTSLKLRRLSKVIYFILTIPVIAVIGFFVLTEQNIYRGSNYYSVNNYYLGALLLLGVLIGYIILTDFFKRLISYINKGSFDGFISYRDIFTKYALQILIFGGITIGGLMYGSNQLQNECTGNNEQFSDNGRCLCQEGYERINNQCIITREGEILQQIPQGSILREFKELPGIKDTYIGIYIKDYVIDPEMDTFDLEMPYSSCPEEVQGQGIKGDYHIFLFRRGKIIDDKKIIHPLTYTKDDQLIFSYRNTKLNNYNFFNGPKPKNEDENYEIEQTNLINFADYNGDRLANEFLLINSWDSTCGHNNYTVVGMSKSGEEIIFYGIKSKDGTINYRGDNFKPNEKGEVENGRNCGDHGADTEQKNIYRFNQKELLFELIESTNKMCTEGSY